jgi:osmotically-inducible protein OsmY
MANQNGRNSSMSDDDRMSWRPQDDENMSSRNRRDDEDRMYGRDRDERRSWDDRWDRQRSIERGGQGQSGYGAGRYGYDERYSRGRYDNYGNYLAQGGQQMGRDRDEDYRSGYTGGGQGGYGSYGNTRSSQPEQHGTHGYGSPQSMGMSGGYNPQHQTQMGQQGYGQQGWGNENAHQYGNTGQWGNYGTPSWNTGSAGMNMGQPGVGGSYNQGYQGTTHGYIGADRPFSHHYGSHPQHPSPQTAGQSNFAPQSYSHLGQHHYGHLGPQRGAEMSGGGQMASGGNYNSQWAPQQYGTQYEEHESLGQRIKGWFQGHRGKGPAGYTRSDERIRENVCEALADDDRVDASNIEVTVKNGEVILTGTVDDRQSKRMAEECVENLSGVKDVQNQLRVGSNMTSSTSRMSQNVDLSTTGSGTSIGQNGADKRHKA